MLARGIVARILALKEKVELRSTDSPFGNQRFEKVSQSRRIARPSLGCDGSKVRTVQIEPHPIRSLGRWRKRRGLLLLQFAQLLINAHGGRTIPEDPDVFDRTLGPNICERLELTRIAI